jgi:hypothetical protein
MWKVNGRQVTDAKWWQKLTLPLAWWAKKIKGKECINATNVQYIVFFCILKIYTQKNYQRVNLFYLDTKNTNLKNMFITDYTPIYKKLKNYM